MRLIILVLVGPPAKIAAAAADEDRTSMHIVAVEHSHAAAEVACRLARLGEVDAIMKGSLPTDELLAAAIDREAGICRPIQARSYSATLSSTSHPISPPRKTSSRM